MYRNRKGFIQKDFLSAACHHPRCRLHIGSVCNICSKINRPFPIRQIGNNAIAGLQAPEHGCQQEYYSFHSIFTLIEQLIFEFLCQIASGIDLCQPSGSIVSICLLTSRRVGNRSKPRKRRIGISRDNCPGHIPQGCFLSSCQAIIIQSRDIPQRSRHIIVGDITNHGEQIATITAIQICGYGSVP